MALLQLGDKVAPKIDSLTSKLPNPSAASIDQYTPSNFSLPAPSKKMDELSNRLDSSGIGKQFDVPYVGGNEMQFDIPNQMSSSNSPASSSLDPSSLKVKISQQPAIGDGPNEIIFKVMPRIDESGGAEYEQITPVQHPGAIQKFRNSTPRTWSVSGKFISRTSEEASENLKLMNMIRSWRMPFFGEGTGRSMTDYLGAPPPVLTLEAYGPNMIGPIKCVMTNYSWSFDNQLDYIPTLEGNPFPVVLDISLSLTESWSPSEFSGFDIVAFKQGNLGLAFTKSETTQPPTQAADANASRSEPSSAERMMAAQNSGN